MDGWMDGRYSMANNEEMVNRKVVDLYVLTVLGQPGDFFLRATR